MSLLEVISKAKDNYRDGPERGTSEDVAIRNDVAEYIWEQMKSSGCFDNIDVDALMLLNAIKKITE